MVFKQGKELAGVEVDLARALGEKLGRQVVFVELDWKDQVAYTDQLTKLTKKDIVAFANKYFGDNYVFIFVVSLFDHRNEDFCNDYSSWRSMFPDWLALVDS